MSEKENITFRVDKEVSDAFRQKIKEEPGKNAHSYSSVVQELMEWYVSIGPPLFDILKEGSSTNFSINVCRFNFSRNWDEKLETDFRNLDRQFSDNSIPKEVSEDELKKAIPYGWRTVKNHIKKMRNHDFITDSRETDNGIFYELDVGLIEDFLKWRDGND